MNQFERLFKLIEFKRDFQNHLIEVIVDNARTHTMREYSLNDFELNPDTRCPVKTIKYFDQNNKQKILNCCFTSEPLKGKSKELLNVAYDLGLSVPVGCKLKELKSILTNHAAFKNVSKIIQLYIFPLFNLKILPYFPDRCHNWKYWHRVTVLRLLLGLNFTVR